MKILLIEDDEKLGAVIIKVFKRQNFDADWAVDRDDASDYIDNIHSYDIVILDWMLPGKNGDEICKELRDLGYLGGIIFLTAKDATSDVIHGIDQGADDYMIKPFENEELISHINSVYKQCRKYNAKNN